MRLSGVWGNRSTNKHRHRKQTTRRSKSKSKSSTGTGKLQMACRDTTRQQNGKHPGKHPDRENAQHFRSLLSPASLIPQHSVQRRLPQGDCLPLPPSATLSGTPRNR